MGGADPPPTDAPNRIAVVLPGAKSSDHPGARRRGLLLDVGTRGAAGARPWNATVSSPCNPDGWPSRSPAGSGATRWAERGRVEREWSESYGAKTVTAVREALTAADASLEPGLADHPILAWYPTREASAEYSYAEGIGSVSWARAAARDARAEIMADQIDPSKRPPRAPRHGRRARRSMGPRTSRRGLGRTERRTERALGPLTEPAPSCRYFRDGVLRNCNAHDLLFGADCRRGFRRLAGPNIFCAVGGLGQ